MQESVTLQRIDPLLHPFLCSASDQETEDLLAKLICEHAEPIISRIVRRKLGVSLKASRCDAGNQDGLEVAGDVRAAIISELLQVRANPEQKVILDFRHYVSVKAYTACADYFKEKHPRRSQLKNMLRHHLKQSEQFEIWEGEGRRWLCGFSPWQKEHISVCSLEELRKILDGNSEHLNTSLPGGDFARQSPADLLGFVFERAGSPVDLDHLVSVIAVIWGVKDLPTESVDDGDVGDRLEQPGASIDKVIEERSYLETLWKEVRSLPALQRAALLLNLRDAEGGGVIAFIPHLGIASKQEIAELAGTPYEEFIELWNDLPLDDATVAERLGLTRQQVINLRKTARERLRRRMRAIEGALEGKRATVTNREL